MRRSHSNPDIILRPPTDESVSFENDAYFAVLSPYLEEEGLFGVEPYETTEIAGPPLDVLHAKLVAASSAFRDKPDAWEHIEHTFTFDTHTGQKSPFELRHPIQNRRLLEIIATLLSIVNTARTTGESVQFIGD